MRASVLLPLVLVAAVLDLPVWGQTAPVSSPPDSLLDQASTLTASGTGAWTAEQIATMKRLRDAAMSDPYAYSQLAYLTDSIGPRLSGSAEAGAAVDRVAAQMRALGATVTLEETEVPHWVRGEETAVLTEWPGQISGSTRKIVLTALGKSPATPVGGITAPVLVVSSFEELKMLPPGVAKGKILLFNRSFDKEMTAQGRGLEAYIQNAPYRYLGSSVGASLGAAAVLVRSLGSADFRLPHTGAMQLADGIRNVPSAAVTAEDADLIARLAQQGAVTLRLTLTQQTLPPVKSYNVVADWRGSEYPEQVVIVSGHLDSWDLGTGAIDDGAGVAMAMETIQLLQTMKLHPRRTVRFIAWMNEEFGASGAATYEKEHAGDVAKHVAAFESDLGCDHPVGLSLTSSALERYLAPLRDVLQPLGAGLFRYAEDFPSEDLEPLVKDGVPGLTPTQDVRTYFDYHHTAADTLDKVDRRHLVENAAVIAVAAYALADASTPAPRVR